MSDQLAIEIAKQIGGMVTSLIWPAFLVILFVRFRLSIANFMARVTELAFKGGGVEVSAKVAQEIVANLSAAEARKQGTGEEDVAPPPSLPTEMVQKTLYQLDARAGANRLRSANILWVDDKPRNNFYEMESLRKLGIAIDTATSTGAANQLLQQRPYELIITDLKRGSDANAGLDFLKSVLACSPQQRIIVYSSYQNPQKKQDVLAAGAKAITSSPSELFDVVVKSLQG